MKMMKRLMKKRLMKKRLNELTKTEQIRLYLNDHPECLTEKLMAWVASYYMNYRYIRMRIKQMYPDIIHENLMKDNFVIVPSKYEQE